MNAQAYTDRFVANTLASWLIACAVMLAVLNLAPATNWWLRMSTLRETAMAGGVAGCAALLVPELCGRLVARRDALFLKEGTGAAAWSGRAVGVLFGLFCGAAVQVM
ncbi:hypothetical protein AB3X91_19140 [Paraburkholderia sp. BR14263]|uniref:hypothetical protein n=1 Tax=unclassified Paraburkholderia TaxID=2615204 RepID=UPI0034CF657B